MTDHGIWGGLMDQLPNTPQPASKYPGITSQPASKYPASLVNQLPNTPQPASKYPGEFTNTWFHWENRQFKNTETYISKINGQAFTNLINHLQDIHETAPGHSETVVAILRGQENIKKHLSFLLKNSEKDVIFSFEKESEKYLKLISNTKSKAKTINMKTYKFGIRVCLVDDGNAVIFPMREEEIHPDYDLGIWIKNNQTTKFLKSLLTSA